MDDVAVENAPLVALVASVRARREKVDTSRERLAAVLEYRADVLENLSGVITDEAHSQQCLILAEQARTRASTLQSDNWAPVR